MSALTETLRAEIVRGGPISFRQFMERALYDPAHGYYASGRAAIGRRGDFMTNVSVGPVFGRLLAVQFQEMWERMERPVRFEVVEQGANNGDFAHDVLSAAQSCPEFFAALHYNIVEPFGTNAARQRERLAAFTERVSWHASLEALPQFTGVHFSNELLDALPMHRVAFRTGTWREQYVAVNPDSPGFCWVDGPLSTPALSACLTHLPQIEGYTSEINLDAPAWLESVARRLERGYVLVSDYGYARTEYYSSERTDGTLSAYRQHRRCENPLADPGEQDLTAHVEFTTLAERAQQSGLVLAGFTDQHHFLAALGRRIFPDITDPSQLTPKRQKETRAFATLIHPTLMGRAFHYFALAKDAPPSLLGYALAANAQSLLFRDDY